MADIQPLTAQEVGSLKEVKQNLNLLSASWGTLSGYHHDVTAPLAERYGINPTNKTYGQVVTDIENATGVGTLAPNVPASFAAKYNTPAEAEAAYIKGLKNVYGTPSATPETPAVASIAKQQTPQSGYGRLIGTRSQGDMVRARIAAAEEAGSIAPAIERGTTSGRMRFLSELPGPQGRSIEDVTRYVNEMAGKIDLSDELRAAFVGARSILKTKGFL